MRQKSEFEIILEHLLRPTSSEHIDLSFSETDISSSFETSHPHPIDYSKIEFSFNTVQQKIFSKVAAQNYQGQAKKMAQKPVQTKIKSKSEVREKEVKEKKEMEGPAQLHRERVRRKLTFDQSKALIVFVRYGELKIDDYSTDDEIKSAYRRLARQFHPDLNKTGAEDFKLISNAFQKLIA